VARCAIRFASVLGTDRRAVLTWQVVAASRILPVALLAAGIAVPAALWSQLPSSRPGPLLIAIVPAVIGIFVTAPQAVHPVVMGPEPFLGPLNSGHLPSLTAAFVRTRLGRLALGVFFLGEAAARAIGLAVINAGAAHWQVPLGIVVGGTAASLLLAAGVSLTLRRFGVGPPAVIEVTSYDQRARLETGH